MKANYHTHTVFCDGRNTPEELVQEAIRLGCPEIGFSGHSYTYFDESYCMSRAGTEEYKKTIRGLQEQYAGRIRIRLGVEQDYYSEEPTGDYDYVIGSVHYVKKDGVFLPVDESREQQLLAVGKYYGGDFYAFAEDYYRTVADLYRKTRCDVIGHFDLIAKFNEDGSLFDPAHPRYRKAAGDALEALLKTPAVFEWNTGAMARGYRTVPYPAPELARRIREAGGRLIFSSDCHEASQLLFGFETFAEE